MWSRKVKAVAILDVILWRAIAKMRQILSAGCIMWGAQLSSGTQVPLATQLQCPQRLRVQGTPKLTGTLMANAGELPKSRGKCLWVTKLLASRGLWIARSRCR